MKGGTSTDTNKNKITKQKKTLLVILSTIIFIAFTFIIIILIRNANDDEMIKQKIDGISFEIPKNWEVSKTGKNINIYPYNDSSAVLNIMTQKNYDLVGNELTDYYMIVTEMGKTSEYFKIKEFKEKSFNKFKFSGAYSVYNIILDNQYYECYLNMFFEKPTNTLYSFNYCEKENINKKQKK